MAVSWPCDAVLLSVGLLCGAASCMPCHMTCQAWTARADATNVPGRGSESGGIRLLSTTLLALTAMAAYDAQNPAKIRHACAK